MTLNEFKDIIIRKHEEDINSTKSSNIQVYSPVFADISQIIKESSYLFYEFEDKTVEEYYDSDNPELGKYSRQVSPLFLSSVINDRSNSTLINIIDEEIPFYHLKPEGPFELEDEYVSESRDPGINDVHSSLQTNSFYQIWLRDVFGYIQNMLILDIYNKLRWPVVLENQYINATLFPTLAVEAFSNSSQNADSSLIEFRNSNVENEEDNNFTEDIEGLEEKVYTKIGNIDYLNDIISQKLSSVYAIIDYHPEQMDILTAWGGSVYGCGIFTEEDLETQFTIYKLQDIKYELLKRKFGGTKTLYNMALSSIDRTGSFVTAVSAAGITEQQDLTFKDKRLIRLLNLPGIVTSYNSVRIDPLTYISQKENAPSINNVSSLYYSSSYNYNAEDFFSDSVSRMPLLRKNVKSLNWGSLESLSEGQSLKVLWNKLDEKINSTTVQGGEEYRKLDTLNEEDLTYTTLDTYTSAGDTSNTVFPLSNIMDISADRLLFNRNSLQKELESNYPYITYPIAENNSVSLMDTYWLDYIQNSIKNKSKVQDNVEYGVQVNKYQALGEERYGRHNFFGISYGTEDFEDIGNVLSEDFSLGDSEKQPTYAYIWYCTLYYKVDEGESSFVAKNISKKLITRITLKERDIDPKFEGIDEYDLLCNYSRGLLPFAYSYLNREKENTLLGLKYGVINDTWVDDLDKMGYTKAIFGFTSLDIVPESIVSSESYTLSQLHVLFEKGVIDYYPTKDTKNVFFVVQKSSDSYRWSSPIKVIPLSKINKILKPVVEGGQGKDFGNENEGEGYVFYPDWYNLAYFLNPYLNFISESASPLRYKEVYTSAKGINNGLDETLTGPSSNAYLSNLTRYRGYEFLCNDKGDRDVCEWANSLEKDHSARNYLGFYLDRQRGEDTNNYIGELVSIYGDNRFIDAYDEGEDSSFERGVPRINEYIKKYCLEFKQGTHLENFETKESTEWNDNLAPNYLKLVPCKDAKNEDYSKWFWNRTSSGITACLNICIGSVEISETNEEKFNKPPITEKIFKKAMLLHREGEFDLYIQYIDEDSFKIVFEYTSSENIKIESSLYKISKESFRIAVSATEWNLSVLLTLIVENDVYSNISSLKEYTSLVNKENNTNPIYIGCDFQEGHQTSCFIGSIFDLRLYTIGQDALNLLFTSQGSTRELFSYSPSNYVLGYNCYVDLGVFNEIGIREISEGNIDEVEKIRIFNRSVWDSILLDRCPVLKEETQIGSIFYRSDYLDPKNDKDIYGWVYGEKGLKDCIELSLEEFEKSTSTLKNGEDNSSMIVNYYGKSIEVKASQKTSIINTLIYPVDYYKSAIDDSSSSLFKIENNIISTKTTSSGSGRISIPSAIKPSDGKLSYEADFNINFTIPIESNFTNYYSKGNNISLIYNNLLEEAAITKLSNTSNSSEANHLLIPFTVPRQPDLNSNNLGYMDRFNLTGLELNSSINTLLIAANYYNELRIPVAMNVISGEGNNKTRNTIYASKWDAIRTFKEGTYYITCKYPFQILPFADYLYDVNGADKYNFLYASVRFKIEVSGRPIVYNSGSEKVEDISTQKKTSYYTNNIKNTLEDSGALISPEDNRTFPHRLINIDLYVQDCPSSAVAGKMSGNNEEAEETYSFTWKLIGTNHPDDYVKGNWIYLTKQRLEDSLFIKDINIPLFFSKNYTSSFFIAKTEKTLSGTKVNSASADDDLIEPIRINPSYNTSKIVSYVRASGVALANTVYYTLNNGSYKIADPQPNYEKNDDVSNYYVRIENLDKIGVREEKDLDSLILVAGRAYKLLWDYTGYVSEFSFIDKIYSHESKAQLELSSIDSEKTLSYTMTSTEKISYSRLSNILDSSNTSEYKYTEDGTEYRTNDVNVSGKTNGYYVYDKEYVGCIIKEDKEIEGKDLLPENGSEYKSAQKTYIEYEVREISEIPISPSSLGLGILYKKGGTYYYLWKGGIKNFTSSALKDFSLEKDNFGGWNFGDFYKDGTSGTIFRAGVTLDDVVFTNSGKLKVWKLFEYTNIDKVLANKYTSSSNCPIPGNTNVVYGVDIAEGSTVYRLVSSEMPYFTDVTVLQNSSEYNSDNFYYGNPYSRSSKNNYLLGIRQTASTYSRNNITNSYSFAYVPEDIPENQYLSSQLIDSNLNTIKSEYGDTAQIAFREKSVLKTQYTSLVNNLTKAVNQLTSGNAGNSQSDSSGIFTSISKISPRLYYLSSYPREAVENTYTRTFTDTLYAYYSSERNYPSKNENILITRRGLYSNNLITNQDFDNESKWSWGEASSLLGISTSSFTNLYMKSYVSDEDWDDGLGKDVCEVTYRGVSKGDNVTNDNSSDPLTLKYLAGSERVGAVYEVALNIKVLDYTLNEDTWESTNNKFYMWRKNNQEKYELTEVTGVVEYCEDSITLAEDLSEPEENKIVVNKSKLLAWGGVDNNWKDLTLEQFNSEEEKDTISDDEEGTLYIESRANDITVKANFLSKGKQVGETLYLGISGKSQGENLKGLAAFDNEWYTVSAEPSSIITADTIAISFLCSSPIKFRITKLVVRKSESRTHALGLSDGLYTKKTSGNNASVYTSSHRNVVFKNSVTKEMIPIQFNPIISKRNSTSSYDSKTIEYAKSGLTRVDEFISENSLGFVADNKKLEKLRNPWVRRMHYDRTISTEILKVYFDKSVGKIYEKMKLNTATTPRIYTFASEITPSVEKWYYFINGNNTQTFVYNSATQTYELETSENGNYYKYENGIFSILPRVPFEEKVSFHSYDIIVDDYGIKTLKENSAANKDIFNSGSISYIVNSSGEGELNVNSVVLNTGSTSLLKKYNTNLEVTEDFIYQYHTGTIIADGPITLSNACISALSNCFDPEKYRNRTGNKVSVTNIQLLGTHTNSLGEEVQKILWEFEYPPIIYDEKEYHSSYNILMHRLGEAGTFEG